jgi:hypothetical protein
MEDSTGKWRNLMSANITGVNRSLVQLGIICNLFANWAVNAIWVKMVFEPLKAGIVVWKNSVKVLFGESGLLSIFHGLYPSLNYSIAQIQRDVKGYLPNSKLQTTIT